MTDTIKPAAWAFQHSYGKITLHPASEYATAYRDTCIATHPLYDQQALDAAVAQERQRIAAALEAMHSENARSHNYYQCLAVLLKEGRL